MFVLPVSISVSFSLGRKAQGAFHHHPVCRDGRENVVHVRQRPQHAAAVYRAGQVEEHDVRGRAAFSNSPSAFSNGILRRALDDRVGFLADALQLAVGHRLVVFVLHDGFQVALAHLGDAVLRVVAVHHRHVQPFHSRALRGRQHRQGRLAPPLPSGWRRRCKVFLFPLA